MMLSPHDDPQTAQDFTAGIVAQDLELAAEKAVQDARQSFCQLRSILLNSPYVLGHYRSEIADLARDFLEVAEQSPRTEP